MGNGYTHVREDGCFNKLTSNNNNFCQNTQKKITIIITFGCETAIPTITSNTNDICDDDDDRL